MRQKDYEQEFTGLLRQHSVKQNNIDEFLDLQNRFTMLYRKKGAAFDYIDFTQEECGELVLDAEDQMAGHSRSLASLLNKVFRDNSPLLTPKFKQAVLSYSRRILQDNRETLRSEADLLVRIRLVTLDYFEKSPHEKVKMCARLQRKLVDTWAQFGKDFSIWDNNQGVIFDSARYRIFLAEEKILDDCILSVYHAALGSVRNTSLMGDIFKVGPSFMRSKKRLNGMEDLLMIETLIRAIDEFILADRWNRDGMAWKINSDMRNQLKSNADVLVSVWQERVENFSNSGINVPVSLYFTSPSDLTENFQPVFAGMLIGQWLSQSNLDQLIDQGRAVNFESDFYLLPQTYAFRKISSADRLRQFKAVRILEVISK
ncbi:MAG: hypothetical protein JKX72_02990 [Robiginitomaculum sp.]|nr:hypothetical protein [Robiginitomaculum sp.]